MFFVGDGKVRLDWKDSAKALVRTLIGAGEVTPGVGEALNRGCDDAQAHQQHEGDEPVRVIDVSQASRIEEAQHGRGVRSRHFIRIGQRTLQNDGAGDGEDDDQNDQYDAGLDRT